LQERYAVLSNYSSRNPESYKVLPIRFSSSVLTREELNFIPVDAIANSFEYFYLKSISASLLELHGIYNLGIVKLTLIMQHVEQPLSKNSRLTPSPKTSGSEDASETFQRRC
jgi:hypothetical protein